MFVKYIFLYLLDELNNNENPPTKKNLVTGGY